MKAIIFENLDKVKPDEALDAIHEALNRLYALNGTNAAEADVSPRRSGVSKGVSRNSKLSSSNRRFVVTGKPAYKNVRPSRLASSILAEIQSAEGRPIENLSQEQLNKYTGVLSGLVQKKVQSGSSVDRESVNAIRHKLETVK